MSFLGIGSRIYDEFTKEAVLGGLLSKAVSMGVGGASKMLGGASKMLGGMAGAAPAAIPRAPVRAARPAAAVAMPRPAAPGGMAAGPTQSPAALPFPKKKPTFDILHGGPELQSPISHPRYQFAYDNVPIDAATFNQSSRAAQIQKRLGELDRRAQELSKRARPGFHGL